MVAGLGMFAPAAVNRRRSERACRLCRPAVRFLVVNVPADCFPAMSRLPKQCINFNSWQSFQPSSGRTAVDAPAIAHKRNFIHFTDPAGDLDGYGTPLMTVVTRVPAGVHRVRVLANAGGGAPWSSPLRRA